jgi:hypothetical protein
MHVHYCKLDFVLENEWYLRGDRICDNLMLDSLNKISCSLRYRILTDSRLQRWPRAEVEFGDLLAHQIMVRRGHQMQTSSVHLACLDRFHTRALVKSSRLLTRAIAAGGCMLLYLHIGQSADDFWSKPRRSFRETDRARPQQLQPLREISGLTNRVAPRA